MADEHRPKAGNIIYAQMLNELLFDLKTRYAQDFPNVVNVAESSSEGTGKHSIPSFTNSTFRSNTKIFPIADLKTKPDGSPYVIDELTPTLTVGEEAKIDDVFNALKEFFEILFNTRRVTSHGLHYWLAFKNAEETIGCNALLIDTIVSREDKKINRTRYTNPSNIKTNISVLEKTIKSGELMIAKIEDEEEAAKTAKGIVDMVNKMYNTFKANVESRSINYEIKQYSTD